MTGRIGKARMALLISAAALLVAAVALSARGRSLMAAQRAHCRVLASLDADMALLDAYSDAAARLEAAGPLPSEVPLPVSIPAPSSCIREVSTTPGGWDDAMFSLRWEAPARTALEALAAICNLDATWRLRSFSLRPLDGGGAALGASVATGRPAGDGGQQ